MWFQLHLVLEGTTLSIPRIQINAVTICIVITGSLGCNYFQERNTVGPFSSQNIEGY